jgi:hypothetical protein
MPGGDVPAEEIPKEYREIALELVRNQGWRYDNAGDRGGHPKLFPADRTQRPIAVPTTPGDNYRGLRNFKSAIRHAGGYWPPPNRKARQ